MTKTILAMLASLVVLIGVMGSLMMSNRSTLAPDDSSNEPILLYCAASNRAVIEAIRSDYEEEFGRTVHIQYGPSQTLLSQLEVSGMGELFLPADDSYLRLAQEKGLVAEILPIARMQAVVVVPADNPKALLTFEDLLQSDLHFVQANPDAAAVGKVTQAVLQASGRWDQLDGATNAYRTTVTDVANDVLIGAADAGIVYDAVLHTYPDLTFVELPELAEANSQISVGVIGTSKLAPSALHFARYVAASDRGQKRYREHGFRVTQGDTWKDVPELSIFAGSMLRPAIERAIRRFEKREGVLVTRVYNGCGVLVAQMKAGQQPDAYFACDSEFMTQVADLFPEPVDVSENELAILVPKGNPHGIATLHDLTRPGLRVGVGHEKQCAMGWLTQNTFREGGLQKEIMANVKVQTPTGDMLVNQLQTGGLDAAVAYLSNAAGATDTLDAIRIQGLECSIAIQPWAVAEESEHSQLAQRLFAQICSAESQEDFLAEGFRWKLEQASQSINQP